MKSPDSPASDDSRDIPALQSVIAGGEAVSAQGTLPALNRGAWLARLLHLNSGAESPLPFSWKSWLASKLLPGEGSRLVRFLLFFAGVLAPLMLLLVAATAGRVTRFGVRTREFTLWELAEALLTGASLAAFMPLLLFAMVACTVALWDFAYFGRKLWVRWGLYSGVILAVHFWYLHAIFTRRAEAMVSFDLLLWLPDCALRYIGIPLAVLVVFWLVGRIANMHWLKHDAEVKVFMLILLGLFGCGLATAGAKSDHTLVTLVGLVLAFPLIPVIALLFAWPWAAPTWALATYVLLSVCAGRQYGGRQLQLWQLFVAFVWFGLYFSAWRLALGQS